MAPEKQFPFPGTYSIENLHGRVRCLRDHTLMASGKIRKFLTPPPPPLPPLSDFVGGDIPLPLWGRRNCRYPPPPPTPSCFSPQSPPPPFLPTLISTPAIIYKITEIPYTIKSSTYDRIIKLICRGFKFSTNRVREN